ncbi:biotin-dependent carboxyltransferase family protein [Arsukibacterium sp.]|uniref:5-oxoprolinase subunit C family protein n=1 Tax=Arsukibacterium sp. TaxID=1977258 RepID=UPI002FDA1DBA
MSGLTVVNPGILCLLQDAGRFGQGALGLTNGGPLDGNSFRWANALLGNSIGSTALELSVGGLQLHAEQDGFCCVTGAPLPFSINGKTVSQWQVQRFRAGDTLELGMMTQGLRSFIAVAGGFAVPTQFGSSATVMREGIGGLASRPGSKLAAGDMLQIAIATASSTDRPMILDAVPQAWRPTFTQAIELRLIESYQAAQFSAVERVRFYLARYTISNSADRMGYKLSGPAIHCQAKPLLSEGICYGAVQIPPDGQPIVLLNDRQTLGGYPKMGAILSLDGWQLAQATPGSAVSFSPITAEDAHNALQLDAARFARQLLQLQQQPLPQKSASTL